MFNYNSVRNCGKFHPKPKWVTNIHEHISTVIVICGLGLNVCTKFCTDPSNKFTSWVKTQVVSERCGGPASGLTFSSLQPSTQLKKQQCQHLLVLQFWVLVNNHMNPSTCSYSVYFGTHPMTSPVLSLAADLLWRLSALPLAEHRLMNLPCSQCLSFGSFQHCQASNLQASSLQSTASAAPHW